MLSLLFVRSTLRADVPTSNTPSGTTDAWQTYRSEQGGFSVDVGATWTVGERLEASGVLITTLTPSSGVVIAIISQPRTLHSHDSPDLMNARCTDVTISARPAKTCFDSMSFSVSTTVDGPSRTFVIMSNRKRGDQRIYDHVLASFRIRQ